MPIKKFPDFGEYYYGKSILLPDVRQSILPNYQFKVGPWNVGPVRELVNCTSRSLKFSVLEPDTASVSLTGGVRDLQQVNELVDDLWVFRDNQLIFKGRIMNSHMGADSSGAASVEFEASSYEAVLDRRLFHADYTRTTYTQEQVVSDIVINAENGPGRDLQIFLGTWPISSGVVRPVEYKRGDSIGQAIKSLSQLPNGFDWSMGPSPNSVTRNVINLWYPRLEIDSTKTVLDYAPGGGNILSWSRDAAAADHANWILQTGAEGTTPVEQPTSVVALDAAAQGVWEKALGDEGLTSQSMVADAASANLNMLSTLRPTWAFELAPYTWRGPSHFTAGHTITYKVRAGEYAPDVFTLDVIQQGRVTELTVEIDDNNLEAVSITVDKRRVSGYAQDRELDRQLQNIRRRV